MNTKNFILAPLGLLALTTLTSLPAVATPTTCSLTNVTTTSYTLLTPGANFPANANDYTSATTNYTPAVNATACVLVTGVANDTPYPDGSINIGILNDGLLNGEPSDKGSEIDYFNNGLFIEGMAYPNSVQYNGETQTGLQFQSIGDLTYNQNNGKVNGFTFGGLIDDPGWVHVGKSDVNNNGTAGAFVASDVLGIGNVILDTIFRYTISSDTCTNGAQSCGNWWLEPDLLLPGRFNTVIQNEATNQGVTVVPDYKYFDAFAIVLKGGTNFAAYLFTAEDLNADLDLFYQFAGTYNTLALGAGLSHISVYAHDPSPDGNVPEPGMLALLSIGLLGAGGMRQWRCATQA